MTNDRELEKYIRKIFREEIEGNTKPGKEIKNMNDNIIKSSVPTSKNSFFSFIKNNNELSKISKLLKESERFNSKDLKNARFKINLYSKKNFEKKLNHDTIFNQNLISMNEKDSFLIYTDRKINEFISLYEEIGSFNGVKNYLKKNHGISVSDYTIKNKIMEKFNHENKDFNKWVSTYNKHDTKYSNEDLELWEKLYEQIGSFLGVSNYLKENFLVHAYDGTIKKKLRNKFNSENRDFEHWLQKYDKSIAKSGFKKTYSVEDANMWKKLYEQIGSYKGVVKYLKDNNSETPIDATIKRIIKENFNREGKNFEEWENRFSKFPLGLTQGYQEEDLDRWDDLYKEIGSFQGVSEYLREKEGTGPADITIKRRLEQKFVEDERDFEKWINEYENWHYQIYTEDNVNEWVLLFEKIGSFYGVEKFLKDRNGQGPGNDTIFVRIKKKFERENLNFEKWRAIFGQRFFEEVCRSYFELIFRTKFLKKSPDWLRNPITGRKMHLDGYNEKLKLAFEYNGPQHYEFTRPYHKTHQDLIYQQRRDALKADYCNANGILLIIIPFTVRLSEMQEEIINQYVNLTGNKLPKMPKYDYKQFFYNDNLDRFL